MRLYFDLDKASRISGLRGTSFSTPLFLVYPSQGELELYFVRNGEHILPSITGLTLSILPLDPESDTVLFSTNSFSTNTRLKKALVPFRADSTELSEQFDAANWDLAVSDGVSKTYEFAESKFSSALARARGFQIRLGATGAYASPGSFTLNPASRTLTLVSVDPPDEDETIEVSAFIPALVCRGQMTLTEVEVIEISGNTSSSSTTIQNSDTSRLFVGAPVSGDGIPGSTTVASIVSPTQFTISNAATATATVSLTSQGNTVTSVIFPVSIQEKV